MNCISCETLKDSIINGASFVSKNGRQLANWCGHKISVGVVALTPIVKHLWGQASLLLKEAFTLATTTIGMATGAAFGLFFIGLGATRIANRAEYQDPEQRAVRAFWRTMAAFAFIGAIGAAGTAAAIGLGVLV